MGIVCSLSNHLLCWCYKRHIEKKNCVLFKIIYNKIHAVLFKMRYNAFGPFSKLKLDESCDKISASNIKNMWLDFVQNCPLKMLIRFCELSTKPSVFRLSHKICGTKAIKMEPNLCNNNKKQKDTKKITTSSISQILSY